MRQPHFSEFPHAGAPQSPSSLHPQAHSSISSSAATSRRRGSVGAHAATSGAAVKATHKVAAGRSSGSSAAVSGARPGPELGLGPCVGQPMLLLILELLDGCLVDVEDTRVIAAAQDAARCVAASVRALCPAWKQGRSICSTPKRGGKAPCQGQHMLQGGGKQGAVRYRQ